MNPMSKFTEAKLEQAFIELLGNEGFPHFLGNTISRADDPACAGTAWIFRSYCSTHSGDIVPQHARNIHSAP